MKIIRHQTAKEFLETSQSLLEAKEAENNLILGLATTLVRDINYYGDNQPLFISVLNMGKCVGACLQTPPRNLILYAELENSGSCIYQLCKYLVDNKIEIPGVIGPKDIVQKFTKTWASFRKVSCRIQVDEMVYKLAMVNKVSISQGKLRQAIEADLELIAEWVEKFYREAVQPISAKEAEEESIKRIREGAFYLWEVEEPKCMAASTRPTTNGITVSYVYTPFENRKKGYATSCVAKLSQLLLKEYEFCTLFTDLSNPTSNSIYQKIGYQAVNHVLQYEFIKNKNDS
ncbi:MAG: hypothetical protein JKX95_08210 [Bacteroidia bacterium]|nr:hypothetical protein [Bacteroidia bacterium]